MSSQTLSLEVEYEGTEPVQIRYRHTIYGLMKLDVDDGVATLQEKWGRLGDRDLADGFTRNLTTGDVLRQVQQLPFVESLEVEHVA